MFDLLRHQSGVLWYQPNTQLFLLLLPEVDVAMDDEIGEQINCFRKQYTVHVPHTIIRTQSTNF